MFSKFIYIVYIVLYVLYVLYVVYIICFNAKIILPLSMQKQQQNSKKIYSQSKNYFWCSSFKLVYTY